MIWIICMGGYWVASRGTGAGSVGECSALRSTGIRFRIVRAAPAMRVMWRHGIGWLVGE